MGASSKNQHITPAMRAEASAWVARLHGPKRDARVEAGFRTWLSANAAHARAFEQTTEAWEVIGSVPRETLSPMVRWDRVGSGRGWVNRSTLSVAAAIVMIAIAALFYVGNTALTTGIGEQRVVTLEDGSRVTLNTTSHLQVHYDKQSRRVELKSGEALFEVAPHTGWPFVVLAGDREIRALGTSFIVRRDGSSVAVTLMDGKVAVAPAGAADQTRVLAPGQRLVVAGTGATSLDTPVLNRVTAWQRGLVILDGTRLDEAVAEMNRYSAVPLQIDSPRALPLRVSGAFRAGDSLSFAQAVARTYSLEVSDLEDRIVLSGTPQATYQ